jgi:hypothetical protein
MITSHRSRFITMGEGSFDQLPAFLLQLFAVLAPDSPPIPIHRLLLFGGNKLRDYWGKKGAVISTAIGGLKRPLIRR